MGNYTPRKTKNSLFRRRFWFSTTFGLFRFSTFWLFRRIFWFFTFEFHCITYQFFDIVIFICCVFQNSIGIFKISVQKFFHGFFELVKKRRSIRRFKKNQVGEEKLKKIFEAMKSAPSSGNLQSYKVFVIRDENKKKEIAKASLYQDFVSQALLFGCLRGQKQGKALWKARRRALLH